MSFFQKIKKSFSDIEQRVPFIPDFSDLGNLGKITLVSFWITVIYSASQVQVSSDFLEKFGNNVKNFIPYLVLQLLFLIIFARVIKKIKPVLAILLIVLLNFTCLYVIQSLIHQSATIFFEKFSSFILQFYVSLGIIFIFLIYFDWREKNLDPANNLAKLIFLQSKMRPHFLFNTLNSVVALMKKDSDTAKKMLLNLSELLRASINEQDITVMYSLREELTLCEKYLAIEQFRLSDRLAIDFDIPESIKDAKVPRLFLQPLIENAILHGIQNLEDGGTIHLKISKNLMNNLIIEIKNPILEKETIKLKKNGNKMALPNLHERLKIYYSNNVVFKHYKDNSNFYIYIDIPYISS